MVLVSTGGQGKQGMCLVLSTAEFLGTSLTERFIYWMGFPGGKNWS